MGDVLIVHCMGRGKTYRDGSIARVICRSWKLATNANLASITASINSDGTLRVRWLMADIEVSFATGCNIQGLNDAYYVYF